jgi:hypothetical protein
MTVEDVRARAARTVEQCILHGTTRMRTQVEVDPGIGMRGFEGVQSLIADYKWAIDIEICVFPQEGLINYPGTDELLVEGLDDARLVDMDVRLDQAGAGEPALRIVDLRLGRQSAFDGDDAALADADIQGSIGGAVGQARVADNEIHHLPLGRDARAAGRMPAACAICYANAGCRSNSIARLPRSRHRGCKMRHDA